MSLISNQYRKWFVCGLLLLATMINYMDRLTLNQSAKKLMDVFAINEDHYGQLEAGFGIAFAVGSLFSGWMADLVNVRWYYPVMVALWSLAGAATGFARNFEELLACRIALGFFEAANWPCALKTTQRLLAPEQRSLGNGLLQSGAALGAVVTPLLMLGFLQFTPSWRPPFWIVGGIGFVWSGLWLLVTNPSDFDRKPVPPGNRSSTIDDLIALFSDRRFWILAVVVVCINATWHFFRAWLPLFLQKARGYSETDTLWFSMCYYISSDVGSIGVGFATLWLAKKTLDVHRSRLGLFFFCSFLTLLSVAVAFLDRGPLLLGLLLILAFGALGLFPNYYSFTQELSNKHQGKVTGILGAFCWVAMFVLQLSVGKMIKHNIDVYQVDALANGLDLEAAKVLASRQAYGWGVAVAGLPPLLAAVAIALFWRSRRNGAASAPPVAGDMATTNR